MRIKFTQRVLVHIPVEPEVVFDVLAGERSFEEPVVNGLERWETLDPGPARLGYRYRSRYLHDGETCTQDIEIVAFEVPRVLEENIRHRCNAARVNQEFRHRFELHPDREGTLLTFTIVRPIPVLRAVAWKLFPAFQADLTYAKKLQHVKGRAMERAGKITWT